MKARRTGSSSTSVVVALQRSDPRSAGTPAGSRSPGRARPTADRGGPTARRGPWRDRRSRRESGRRRPCSRPASRPPCTPAPAMASSSPRTPSRASRTRRGAGARSRRATKGGVCSSRSSHISRQRSPTNAGSGGRALKASIVDAQGSMSDAEQAAAHVVHVRRVAVVGGADGDHAAELGRAPRRDLQAVEAAPRLADDADRPVHHGCAASQSSTSSASSCSCGRYSSSRIPSESPEPRWSTRTAGVAVAGEPRVHERVARRRAVVLAVRDVLEDRGHGIGLGVLGQPDARRQACAVGERDERVRDRAHAARELGADPHQTGVQDRAGSRR